MKVEKVEKFEPRTSHSTKDQQGFVSPQGHMNHKNMDHFTLKWTFLLCFSHHHIFWVMNL